MLHKQNKIRQKKRKTVLPKRFSLQAVLTET